MQLHYQVLASNGLCLLVIKLKAPPDDRAEPLTLVHAPAILALFGTTISDIDSAVNQLGIAIAVDAVPAFVDRLRTAAAETEATWRRHYVSATLEVVGSVWRLDE